MKIISNILSFKGVKLTILNIIGITLCHFILFSIFNIEKYQIINMSEVILWFFCGYMIWSNLYFFTNKIKSWMYCNIFIILPFELIYLVKWVLIKWHFVSSTVTENIKINLLNTNNVQFQWTNLNWIVSYFPLVILAITLYFIEDIKNFKVNNYIEEKPKKVEEVYNTYTKPNPPKDRVSSDPAFEAVGPLVLGVIFAMFCLLISQIM